MSDVSRELLRFRVVVAAQLVALQEAQSRTIRVGLAERRRLEQTLHDETQQRLLAASAAIGLARIEVDDARRREALADAAAALRAALDELRGIARDLYPVVLTREGLAAAVRELAARSPVAVEASVEVGRLPEVLEAAAYQVVGEALTYAVRAGAGGIVLRLAAEGDGVRIEAVDDGVLRPVTGLQPMADLVRGLGGTVDVSPEPTRGVRICALLPR